MRVGCVTGERASFNLFEPRYKKLGTGDHFLHLAARETKQAPEPPVATLVSVVFQHIFSLSFLACTRSPFSLSPIIHLSMHLIYTHSLLGDGS